MTVDIGQHKRDETPRTWSSVLLTLALGYAFFGLGFESAYRPLLIVCFLLTGFVVYRYQSVLFRTAPFIFFITGTLIALMSWLLMRWQLPEVASRSPRIEELTDKFIFLPLGVILAGCKCRTLIFWSVAALAALATPWFVGDGLVELKYAVVGKRTGFGLHPITMGMIYGVVLIGALVFFHRLQIHTRWGWLRFLLWLFVVMAAIVGILGSQTRAVYAGLFGVFFLIFFMVLLMAFCSFEKYRKPLGYFFAAMCLVCISSTVLFF